jgi:hypothetical protein
MKKVKEFIENLKKITFWDSYLMEQSGLPGPRANLELVKAVSELGDEERFLYLISFTLDRAPVNSQEEFLALCGTVGLGKLIAQGNMEYLRVLQKFSADPRWRVREGVAMALQIYGESHMENLIEEMKKWVLGNCYMQRAAIAALCEPKLLSQRDQVTSVLRILDEITNMVLSADDRKDEGFIALRKGLAYCWSVAIVHNSEVGMPMFEKWLSTQDKDIKWVIKENLKKNRLLKMDGIWVNNCLDKMK